MQQEEATRLLVQQLQSEAEEHTHDKEALLADVAALRRQHGDHCAALARAREEELRAQERSALERHLTSLAAALLAARALLLWRGEAAL